MSGSLISQTGSNSVEPNSTNQVVQDKFQSANTTLMQSAIEQKPFYSGMSATLSPSITAFDSQNNLLLQAPLDKKNKLYTQLNGQMDFAFYSGGMDASVKEATVGYNLGSVQASAGVATQKNMNFFDIKYNERIYTPLLNLQRVGDQNAEQLSVKAAPNLQALSFYSANHDGKLRYQIQGDVEQKKDIRTVNVKPIFGSGQPAQTIVVKDQSQKMNLRGTVSVPIYKFIGIGLLGGVSTENISFGTSSDINNITKSYGGFATIGARDDTRIRIEIEKSQVERISTNHYSGGEDKIFKRDYPTLRAGIGCTSQSGPFTFDFIGGWDTSGASTSTFVSPLGNAGGGNLPTIIPTLNYIDLMYAKVRMRYDF